MGDHSTCQRELIKKQLYNKTRFKICNNNKMGTNQKIKKINPTYRRHQLSQPMQIEAPIAINTPAAYKK